MLQERLESPAGVELCAGKMKVDTLLVVARDDARTADARSGRGVATSHETVAKRVGMSSRHVRTARRIIEKLGMSVTIVLGRHLSPAERADARASHGGYQEAAASVRALTMPAPATTAPLEAVHPLVSDDVDAPAPVDTFHLPRSGYVRRSLTSQRWSPTRVTTREAAAARPKPKRKTHARPERAPHDPALQRFAWDIAANFMLLDGSPPRQGAPLSPGALAGGRHIGQLIRILQRTRITPDRYTVRTLNEALSEVLPVRRETDDPKRDRLAVFAWKLDKLAQRRPGPTHLEQQRQEAAERLQQRREQQKQAVEASLRQEELQEASQQAADAFFAQARRTRRPRLTQRVSEQGGLVTALLGEGAKLYDAPTALQIIVGAATRLHKTLLADGWALTTADHDRLTWTSMDGRCLHVDIRHVNDTVELSPTPPAVFSPALAELVAGLA